jgi:hypothetical protein
MAKIMGHETGQNGHELGYDFALNDPVKSDGILRVAKDSRLSRLLIV